MRREAFFIGPLPVYWYSLCFALAFVVGYGIMGWIYRREEKPQASLDALLFAGVIGTIVGARLGHVLFYEPAYFLTHPLEILKTWHGGLASHGGVLGLVAAMVWHARRHPAEPAPWLIDRLAVAVAPGAALVRLGNLFNSEIVGRPTDVPWAFVFTALDQRPRHPAQLYEALAYLAVAGVMLWVYPRAPGMRSGRLTGLLLTLVFGARFAIEFFKEPQAAFELDLALNMGQLLSLPVIAVGLWLLLRRPAPGAAFPPAGAPSARRSPR
jgi:prolipoprotein diacylglyceryl transferase